MKKTFFILIILMIIYSSTFYSQWNQYTIPSSYPNKFTTISYPAFPTADVGYVVTSVLYDEAYAIYNNAKVFKSTNKGKNWTCTYNISGNHKSSVGLYFVNANTGFFAKYLISESPYTINIFKTTDGGNNWNNIGQINNITHPHDENHPDHIPSYIFMKFANENTGYLCEWTNVYKTTNSGNTWVNIKNHSSYYYNIVDIALSKYDNTVYLGGFFGPSANPVIYASSNAGNNFITICDGSINYGVGKLMSISLIENVSKVLYCLGDKGIGKVVDFGNMNLVYMHFLPFFGNYHICFTKENEGAHSADYPNHGILHSTNSGVNWSNEYYLGNIHTYGMVNAGDVICSSGLNNIILGTENTYVFVRKIPIHGQYAFDLIPNPSYSGVIEVDDLIGGGGILFVPDNLEVYGGTLKVGTERILENGNKIFYRWQTAMEWGYPYIDRTDNYITANFKTKLKSTVPNAIAPVSQTKAIKDTNGVINLIYESMGGIFYTRSTDNGSTFSMEEIVNYHPSEFSGTDNYNPCLAEIKPYYINHPYPEPDAQNMAAVWERREGYTIKIRFSERENYEPEPPLNWKRPVDLFTVSDVPSGFECKPKLFMVKEYNNWDSLVWSCPEKLDS